MGGSARAAFVLGGLLVALGVWIGRRNPPVFAQDDAGASRSALILRAVPLPQGGALAFVLDTEQRVLSVYEAQGGTRATRGITFVASRKIARDRYVTGYNDQSEYSYEDLGRLIAPERAAPEDGGRARSSDRDSNGPGGSGRR